MVVIYDRFVFFSVEKFFIPLLYSCLNILVQRSCEWASKHARMCMCVCVRGLYAWVCEWFCSSDRMPGCVYVIGNVVGKRKKERKAERDENNLAKYMLREKEGCSVILIEHRWKCVCLSVFHKSGISNARFRAVTAADATRTFWQMRIRNWDHSEVRKIAMTM